ncbi:MAG: N-acetyltransferase family protein [Bacteroidetes bacterium]|nr:MAG: N-acetyltransferase family protein [Bacteroidota bacterium]
MLSTTEKLKIEICQPADYECVAEIYNEHILLKQSTMDQELKTAENIRAWVDKMNEREALYVLRREGNCIGWGIIKRYSERAGYRYACETAIYLRQAETGKGYGTFLKKFIMQRCRELGYHHLVAKIFATNTASIAYNQRLGYEVVGRQKEIGWVNGQWMDVVIMQYLFDKHIPNQKE